MKSGLTGGQEFDRGIARVLLEGPVERPQAGYLPRSGMELVLSFILFAVLVVPSFTGVGLDFRYHLGVVCLLGLSLALNWPRGGVSVFVSTSALLIWLAVVIVGFFYQLFVPVCLVGLCFAVGFWQQRSRNNFAGALCFIGVLVAMAGLIAALFSRILA